MYKQVAAWALHGLLVDEDQEFFVRRVSEDDASQGYLSHEVRLLIGGVGNGQGLWNAFTLALEMLPPYIPLRLANQVTHPCDIHLINVPIRFYLSGRLFLYFKVAALLRAAAVC